MADNKKSSISRRSSCYLLNLKQPDKTAKRLKLSLKRTAGRVLILKADRSVEASVGFLDVSETGAGVFTPELLHKGSMVELCITEPAVMKVRGIVAWSIPITSGIHAGKYRCRSGIQFVFDGDAQKASLLDFVQKAGQDPIDHIRNAPVSPPAVPVPSGNNTDATLAAVMPAAAADPAAVAAPVTDPSVAPVSPAPVAEAAPAAPVAEAAPAAPVAEAAPAAPVAEAAPAAPVAEAAPAAPETGTPDSGQKAA